MKHLFLFILLAWGVKVFSQEVIINELQASNITTYKSGSYYYDWIELKNTTSSDIDLSGWFLSDDPEELYKRTFSEGTNIEANSFLLVSLSSGFNLSASGETVVLTSSDSSEVHRLEYPSLMNDISYGRIDDGSYSYMNVPSPNSENISSSAFTYLQSELSTNLPSGLYENTIDVELTKTGDGQIYFTLDGTTPTSSSEAYTGAISINSSTMLKAIVIKSAQEYSIIENRSYIIGASHSLPIVLLTSDYSSYDSRNKQVIDGRIEFCFIEEDGTTAINQYANFETSGNTSAYLPQLNGKVKANKIYGEGDFDYKMFPNKDVDEFESFLLRNASQDWACTYLMDGFVSNILSEDNLIDIKFEGYRPAVLYVNSEYHGIINVREDDDKDFIKCNWNLDKDEFSTNTSLYPSIWNMDFTTEEDRTEFEQKIDLYEYASINFLSKFTDDMDYRLVYWADLAGKTNSTIHYFFHDFDTGLGRSGTSSEYANYLLVDTIPVDFDYMIANSVKAYAPYCNEVLQIIAAQVNHLYRLDRTLEILDSTQAKIKDEIPAHAIKMNELANESTLNLDAEEMPYASIDEWNKNIADLRTNISYRIDTNFFDRVLETYGLDSTINVTYSSSDSTKGFVRVQGVKVLEQSYTGTYFSNIEISFTAEALPGYRFLRWEGDVTSSNSEISPVFSSSASITAVFELVETTNNQVVINEIQGKNNTTVADNAGEYNDWIEIYNPTDSAVDLAGYYLSDNFEIPLKWQIPDTDSSKTTVQAKGFLLLWADKDTEQGENHLDFKLKPSDQVILTSPDGTTTLQYIEYSNVEADKSFAAETDGSSTFSITDNPTPNATNVIAESDDTIIVIFKDYDETVLKTDTVDYGSAATAPNDPTRAGYTFTGWDTDYSNITSDLTVTALYTINSYTVTFKDYDGTILKTETVNYGSAATAPTSPTRTGYTFFGWDVDFSIITDDLIVTAEYEAITSIAKKESYSLRAYPNPVSDVFYINMETAISRNFEIIIQNNLGQVVYRRKCNSTLQTINIESFSRGVYFVKIDNFVCKIIKE